jgi:flagellar hook-basal body complex protein FliE
MSASIQPVSPAIVTEITLPAVSSPSHEFRDLLTDSIAAVEQKQQQSQDAVNQFLSGGGGEVHSIAIAAQRAELSMDLFLQVRNKVISAYQEVMKLQM